jgi:hypothetical protein
LYVLLRASENVRNPKHEGFLIDRLIIVLDANEWNFYHPNEAIFSLEVVGGGWMSLS